MLRNHKEKVAVIGGGIGGVCTSQLFTQKGYDVTLFEKSNNLGGCSGSFRKGGFIFNVGATTIAGLKDSYPVKGILSSLKIKEDLIKFYDPSIVVHTPKGKIRRFSSLKPTIDEVERVFPNRANKEFWSKVYEVTKGVLTYDLYHNFTSLKGHLKSFFRSRSLVFRYAKPFFIPAERGLREYFPNLDKDYYDFMDAHVKIVAQCSIGEVSFLTLLLSLGYPFTGVGYPEGGMGELFKEVLKSPSCLLGTEIKSLSHSNGSFILKGDFGEESFQKVILAFPVFENMHVIKDKGIESYLKKYIHLNSDNSAIVLYGVLKDFVFDGKFHLKILRESLPYTSSRYLFFSFDRVRKEDSEFTTFTVSTHTKASYWINLQRELYDIKKQELKMRILNTMAETFGFNLDRVVQSFLATPETFFRYLGRRNVGGNPVTRQNTFWRIPSNFTPFKNLYLVGDSFFCYQGWIGISIGIRNLVENFRE